MIEPTGERFIPELMGGDLIEAEHVVRYALAAQLARGRNVLDAGCGVGWGTAMLLGGGAASASGLDIDAEAIENARERTPGGDFRVGDLRSIPFADASFDLVVCFEAIEHVDGHEKVLDELVRVMRPDGGLLLVSSPNPAVYPAGNPFHIRELSPSELRDAVLQRLPFVEAWHQYSQVASVLLPEAEQTERTAWVCELTVPVVAGNGPYSLMVAGNATLPTLQLAAGFAPSTQLDHLQEASEYLEKQRQAMSEDQQRVVDERRIILAEREDLLSQLRDADTALRALTEAHNDALSSWNVEREELRRDRERTAWLLVDAEQRIASLLTAPTTPLEPDGIDLEIVALRRTLENREQEISGLEAAAANLRQEIAAIRSSTSWRVTRPLRGVSGLIRPRKT